jgi:hypothetical protein
LSGFPDKKGMLVQKRSARGHPNKSDPEAMRVASRKLVKKIK